MIIEPLALGTFSPYAILISLSAALGLFLSWWLDSERRTLMIDAGLALILFALIGARTGYVIRNLAYFQIYPWQIPLFWLGGLTWSGALLGAALGMVVIHWIWKEPLGELLDSYLPLLGAVSAGIWITSWWAGTGYGPETSAWFGIQVQDLFGRTAQRWPFPILGAVLSAGWMTAAVLFPLKRGTKPGFRGLLGLVGTLGIQLLLSLFMADPAPVLWGLRRANWISFLFIVITSIGILILTKEGKDERTET